MSKPYNRGERHEVGTLVQHRDGYVFLKTEKGMVAQHRWIAEQKILGRDLREGEVVVRKEPDRLNNNPENLVVVRHNLVKFKMLPQARVLWVPSRAVKRVMEVA